MEQETETKDKPAAAAKPPATPDWADIGAAILGASPGLAMGFVYMASACSLGQSFANAVSAQQAMNQVARDATVAESELLLGLRRTPCCLELLELLKAYTGAKPGAAGS